MLKYACHFQMIHNHHTDDESVVLGLGFAVPELLLFEMVMIETSDNYFPREISRKTVDNIPVIFR